MFQLKTIIFHASAFCCSVTGEEAHQRLLPQPYVPSASPHQHRGPADILPAHPILPRLVARRH